MRIIVFAKGKVDVRRQAGSQSKRYGKAVGKSDDGIVDKAGILRMLFDLRLDVESRKLFCAS